MLRSNVVFRYGTAEMAYVTVCFPPRHTRAIYIVIVVVQSAVVVVVVNCARDQFCRKLVCIIAMATAVCR